MLVSICCIGIETILCVLIYDNLVKFILGNFDGIHKGHKIILEKAVKKAKEKNLKTIVYTFSEYPKNYQNKITTCSEKAYLLNENKIDYLYLEEFEKVRKNL